jgi:phage terminase small subunit
MTMTPRHRKFCQAVASGMSPPEAAVSAGYRNNNGIRAAKRLMLLASTMAFLADAGRGKTEAIEQAVAAKHFALKCGDALAFVAAIELRCRLEGLLS